MIIQYKLYLPSQKHDIYKLYLTTFKNLNQLSTPDVTQHYASLCVAITVYPVLQTDLKCVASWHKATVFRQYFFKTLRATMKWPDNLQHLSSQFPKEYPPASVHLNKCECVKFWHRLYKQTTWLRLFAVNNHLCTFVDYYLNYRIHTTYPLSCIKCAVSKSV